MVTRTTISGYGVGRPAVNEGLTATTIKFVRSQPPNIKSKPAAKLYAARYAGCPFDSITVGGCLKWLTISFFASVGLFSCAGPTHGSFAIAESKTYEASLFRQYCAICHGPEGQGATLENGTMVPSLRNGEFKFHSEDEIYKQISAGGNGMTPFRDILTDGETTLMTKFVHDKLRNGQK